MKTTGQGRPHRRVGRAVLLAATFAVASLCDVASSQAYYGNCPWCAVQSLGLGIVTENCTMLTFEQCRMETIAGNRGYCIPNPYRAGAQGAVEEHPWLEGDHPRAAARRARLDVRLAARGLRRLGGGFFGHDFVDAEKNVEESRAAGGPGRIAQWVASDIYAFPGGLLGGRR